MPVTMHSSVYHVVYDIHDKNVILWRATYVSSQKFACLVNTQNQPGVVECAGLGQPGINLVSH